jgi:hypothetical protein
MGAVDYSVMKVVKGNVRDAYNEAYDDARDENGHQQGYSGDIQNADGYSEASGNPRYGTQSFWNWEAKQFEDMGKGDCYYIEIKGAVAKRIKGRRWKGRKGIRVFYFFGVGRD